MESSPAAGAPDPRAWRACGDRHAGDLRRPGSPGRTRSAARSRSVRSDRTHGLPSGEAAPRLGSPSVYPEPERPQVKPRCSRAFAGRICPWPLPSMRRSAAGPSMRARTTGPHPVHEVQGRSRARSATARPRRPGRRPSRRQRGCSDRHRRTRRRYRRRPRGRGLPPYARGIRALASRSPRATRTGPPRRTLPLQSASLRRSDCAQVRAGFGDRERSCSSKVKNGRGSFSCPRSAARPELAVRSSVCRRHRRRPIRPGPWGSSPPGRP
jgi:hypothetical protein